jgi:hypothetical protein
LISDQGAAWDADRQRFNAVRAALGLPETPPPAAPPQRYLELGAPASRARHWGRLQARWLSDGGELVALATADVQVPAAARVPLDIRPAAAAQPGVVPRCPGPFGGTTVVVLPDGTSEADVAAWIALEENDPLAAASRFHRVRMATESGERSLVGTLARLQSENRRNVLIVPAAFYAAPAWLQSLRESVAELEDAMTLHWLPGLGGRQGALSAPAPANP